MAGSIEPLYTRLVVGQHGVYKVTFAHIRHVLGAKSYQGGQECLDGIGSNLWLRKNETLLA